jgi:hypothetical protein
MAERVLDTSMLALLAVLLRIEKALVAETSEHPVHPS